MVWMRPSRVPKKERKKERKRHSAGGVGCRVSGDVFDAGVLVEVVVADREAGKGNGKKVKSKQEGRKGARVEGGVGAAGIYLGRSNRTEKKKVPLPTCGSSAGVKYHVPAGDQDRGADAALLLKKTHPNMEQGPCTRRLS